MAAVVTLEFVAVQGGRAGGRGWRAIASDDSTELWAQEARSQVVAMTLLAEQLTELMLERSNLLGEALEQLNAVLRADRRVSRSDTVSLVGRIEHHFDGNQTMGEPR